MSKRLLTQEQIKRLRENQYVKSVTPRVITFTPEFKQWAYDELYRGKPIDYYNNDRYHWDLAKLSPCEYYRYVTTGVYPLPIYRSSKSSQGV